MSYFPLIVGGAITSRGNVWLEHAWSMLKYKVAPKVMCILHYVLKFSLFNETVPFLANSSTYHTLITEKKARTLSVSYYSLTSVLAIDQNNKRNLHNYAICLHVSASPNVSEFLEIFTDDDKRYTKPALHVKEPNINTIHTIHCIFFNNYLQSFQFLQNLKCFLESDGRERPQQKAH